MKIAFFDSGMGGLFLLQQILAHLPAEYLYFADTANMPYGSKSAQEIADAVHAALQILLTHKPDLIVIACFSASVITQDLLPQSNIPIITMLDLVKFLPLAETTGSIGVIATPATIDNAKLIQQLERLYPGKNFIGQACPALALAIEQRKTLGELQFLVAHYCENLLNKKVSTIILGCTHYESLLQVIGKQAPYPIAVLGFGRILLDVLKKRFHSNLHNKVASLHIVVTSAESLSIYQEVIPSLCSSTSYTISYIQSALN